MPDGGARDPPDGVTGEPGTDGGQLPGTDADTGGTPDDETVVRIAAAAAEAVVLDRYKQSNLRDIDVTVRFEGGVLDVDVYLNVPDVDEEEQEAVAERAVRAAADAVDELFAEAAEAER